MASLEVLQAETVLLSFLKRSQPLTPLYQNVLKTQFWGHVKVVLKVKNQGVQNDPFQSPDLNMIKMLSQDL